jgi:hypothetical protein
MDNWVIAQFPGQIFLSSKTSRPAFGPTRYPIKWVLWLLHRSVMRSGPTLPLIFLGQLCRPAAALSRKFWHVLTTACHFKSFLVIRITRKFQLRCNNSVCAGALSYCTAVHLRSLQGTLLRAQSWWITPTLCQGYKQTQLYFCLPISLHGMHITTLSVSWTVNNKIIINWKGWRRSWLWPNLWHNHRWTE